MSDRETGVAVAVRGRYLAAYSSEAAQQSAGSELLLQAIGLRRAGRFADARESLLKAVTRGLDPKSDELARCERAYLHYYSGEFREGAELAASVARSSDTVTGARARVIGSVNVLALNDANRALGLAHDALTRLRSVGADDVHFVDAQVQLTHIYANMGRPSDAIAAGRAAVERAHRGRLTDWDNGHAKYALGFALSYAGEPEAMQHLLEAERLTRDMRSSLWSWILFCIATHLRDLGMGTAASHFLARSAVTLRHERAWFAYLVPDYVGAFSWFQSHVREDERPFARAIIAAIGLATGRARRSSAERAVRDFALGGLDHWRWGVMWLMAASVEDEQRVRVLTELFEELEARSIHRWGFYDPSLVERLTRWAHAHVPDTRRQRTGLRVGRPRAPNSDMDELMLTGLGLVNPEAIMALNDAGVSPSEARTLFVAVRAWLDERSHGRSDLGKELHLRDSSVRSSLNHLRSKLGIERRRGVEPLILWLAERDLLAPSAAQRAVARLAR